jgi:hypothetical protein
VIGVKLREAPATGARVRRKKDGRCGTVKAGFTCELRPGSWGAGNPDNQYVRVLWDADANGRTARSNIHISRVLLLVELRREEV